MTRDDRTAGASEAAGEASTTERNATRRTRIETTHADRAAARTVVRAVSPDNTDDVATAADGSTVDTRIGRPTTGGLQSTADDYVVNVRVADRVIGHARCEPGTSAGTTEAAAGDVDGADGPDDTDDASETSANDATEPSAGTTTDGDDTDATSGVQKTTDDTNT